MAGSGRRSHYRKHLTDAVLHDLPEPDETIGQRIARIVGSRGYDKFFLHVFLYDAQIIGILINTSYISLIAGTCLMSSLHQYQILKIKWW